MWLRFMLPFFFFKGRGDILCLIFLNGGCHGLNCACPPTKISNVGVLPVTQNVTVFGDGATLRTRGADGHLQVKEQGLRTNLPVLTFS